LLRAAWCRLLSHDGGEEQCLACEAEHGSEAALLEDLGRLLGDVRASARCAPLPPRDPDAHAAVRELFYYGCLRVDQR
jgi:hypothetical protein